jgi:hypothetical protein
MSEILLTGSAGGERKSGRDIGFACGIIAILSIGRLKDEVQHRGNAFGGGTLWAKNTSS